MSNIAPYVVDYVWLLVVGASVVSVVSVLLAKGVEGSSRLMWALISFVPVIGPVSWFFVGRREPRANHG